VTRPAPTRGVKRPALAALAICALAVLLAPAAALAAEPPPILWGKEPLVCPSGSGAGQCVLPRGIAADPSNGHIFVADSSNRRLVEFNPLGQFIKAWGWGIDTGAPELQICTESSTCEEGLTGSGIGEFGSPQGVAVDSAGNIYVIDRGLPSNQRVQKFDRKGNFMLMFGGGVNKTKVEEGTASETEENLCPFDVEDECQGGSEGTGHGQFGHWPATGGFITIDRNGTATDTDDMVYVGDVNRIQVFDIDGHYQGEIALPGKSVQGLAVDEEGNLYYIDAAPQRGVHKISPSGMPLAPESFEFKDAEGKPVSFTAVAVDAGGDVYAFGPPSCCGNQNNLNPIIEFDPEGKVIAEFGKGEFASGSTGLATNLCAGSQAPGNLYVTNASVSEAFLRAYGTDPIGCGKVRTLPATHVEEKAATLNGTVNPKGEAVTECSFEYGTTTSYGHSAGCVPSAAGIGSGSTPVPVKADISGLTKGTVYHFRLIAKIGGEDETGADEEFKTKGPPVISEEHVLSASGTEAVLKALVNPEGFKTSYHFEYTTLTAFDAKGFEGGQSTAEIEVGEDRSNHAAFAELDGLLPGTAYRWRVVAKNESGESASKDHPLFTYLPFVAETGCPNQSFRGGSSAFLPDCRAYEMVSPLDKNGGDITREIDSVLPGNYVQAAVDGNGITYTALSAFADPPNAFNFNQYLARRQERGQPGEGWSSEGIHTPVAGQRADPTENFGLQRDFMAFTPDLCSAWLIDHQTPPPTADGQEGFPNLYRREDCGGGAGSFEALVPAPPTLPEGTLINLVTHDSVQGYSADGSEAIFAANAKLLPEAAEGSGAQLYDRSGGALHLVSVLPGGKAASGSNAVGSGPERYLDNAVSEDGSLVYWSGAGKEIFVRRHPDQGVVEGECSEAAVTCTLPVSAGTNAFFWTATPNGSKAIYSKGEDLFVFDLGKAEAEEPAQTLIAHHVKGVAGASDDLSRIYFVSTDALTGEGEPNSNGDLAIAGKPNLYLAEGGAFSFIGTLAAGDVGAQEPGADVIAYSVIEESPYYHATRVSADGSRIAFDSRAPLTGYDNTGPDGRPAVEVFAYEAGGSLACVSCNPSGARPRGVAELRRPYAPPSTQLFKTLVPAAAWIPTWEHELHASNALSANGKRLFFNSNDALLPRDANGAPDVYEWEAPGSGGCNTKSASYFAQNGGCIYLISSGESPSESEFWEASPDGRDVFFTTSSSLLPQDPGSVDLYDARIEGGFPQPEVKAPCEGEACQSPPAPPNDPTPASSAFEGAGNVVEPITRPCRKGKVRRKGRCVARKHRKPAKHANHRATNRHRSAGG
jgi:DNA-binding beta-propeller fold protein YncE